MQAKLQCYELIFEYRDDARNVNALTSLYTADSRADAIKSALALWDGRNAAFAEEFTELLCCKISEFTIGPIVDGAVTNGRTFAFFEYKCDTAGVPMRDYFRKLHGWEFNANA